MAEHKLESAGMGLGIALAITLLIFVLQVAGGLMSNSLALLSDSGHVLSDSLSLAVSWFAFMLATRPAGLRRTFGYHRAEVFAALINSLLLLAMALVVAYEAYLRAVSPPAVNAPIMLMFALLGLIGNVYVVARLGRHKNLNVRSAMMHALSDALSSVGVIIGAVAIAITGATVLDSAVSVLIAGLMLVGAYRIGRDALRILFEFSPRGKGAQEICKIMYSVEGVREVHDVHVWSVCSDLIYLTAHVVVDDGKVSGCERIADALSERLRKKLGISHTTFQFETEGHKHGKEMVCEIGH